jgi:hypothetical protein
MLNRSGYVPKCAITGRLIEEKRPTVKVEENTMIGPA